MTVSGLAILNLSIFKDPLLRLPVSPKDHREINRRGDLGPIIIPVAKRSVRRSRRTGGWAVGAKKRRKKGGIVGDHCISAYRKPGRISFPRIHDSGAAPLARNPRTETWVGRSSQPNLLRTCQAMDVHLYTLQCTE